MYEITVQIHFSGAHFLREYKGKCENLHGHNWVVEATLSGDKLDDAGLLYDFKVIKRDLNEIVDEFDHTLLNDHPEFKEQNPSAERIAEYIYKQLENKIKDFNVNVKDVCVHESVNSWAKYRES